MTGTGGGEFTLAPSRYPEDRGLSTGALIGIVISVIVCTLIIIIVVVYLVTQPKKRQKLWIKSRSLFQSKVKINKCEVLTLQKYEEVNFLHSKAAKGECYKNESFSSEDNIGSNTDTVSDRAYTDSNCNQNHPGSDQLTGSSVDKNENSPASHLTDSDIPPSKMCLTIVEIYSDKTEETWDNLEKKKPKKKKNHLKRLMDNSKSDLIDKAESLGNENK
ncbi:hypothetical protein ACJMK2_036057 [Sinanodonta woodiana]|uniref:Uncharacterized protein n=1 Tax=Sinanodonta woodiana TaxID=1069815 RepID=A0ABD3WG07_SINWO